MFVTGVSDLRCSVSPISSFNPYASMNTANLRIPRNVIHAFRLKLYIAYMSACTLKLQLKTIFCPSPAIQRSFCVQRVMVTTCEPYNPETFLSNGIQGDHIYYSPPLNALNRVYITLNLDWESGIWYTSIYWADKISIPNFLYRYNRIDTVHTYKKIITPPYDVGRN